MEMMNWNSFGKNGKQQHPELTCRERYRMQLKISEPCRLIWSGSPFAIGQAVHLEQLFHGNSTFHYEKIGRLLLKEDHSRQHEQSQRLMPKSG
jgi:hypothetical protein